MKKRFSGPQIVAKLRQMDVLIVQPAEVALSVYPFEAWTDDLLKFFGSPKPLDKFKKGFQLNSLICRIRLKLLQIPKSIRLSFLYEFYIVETSAIILQDAA